MQHAPAARPSRAPAARPSRIPAVRPLPGAALAAVLALTATACVGGGRGADEADGTVSPTAQSPAALPSSGLPPVLTRGRRGAP